MAARSRLESPLVLISALKHDLKQAAMRYPLRASPHRTPRWVEGVASRRKVWRGKTGGKPHGLTLQ